MIITKHIFRGGPTVSSTGRRLTYTQGMLQEIVDSYNPQIHEGPVVFGHSGDNRIHFTQPLDGRPAGGWIKSIYRDGLDLFAVIETTKLGEQALEKKLYKKVSASFYSPEMPSNPTPGQWSLRHVALLGADPPAIKGLEDFSFEESNEDEEELTFLLNEEFAPTKKSELPPFEQLRELYKGFKKEKAKEEKDALDKEKAQAQQAQPDNPPKHIDFDESKSDTKFGEELMSKLQEFVETLDNDNDNVTAEYGEKVNKAVDKLEKDTDTDTEYSNDEDMEYSSQTEEEEKAFGEGGCGKKKKKGDMEYKNPVSYDKKIKKVMQEDENDVDEDLDEIEALSMVEGQDHDKVKSDKRKALYPKMGNNNYAEMEAKLAQLEEALAQQRAQTMKLERDRQVAEFSEFTKGLYAKGQLTETLVPSERLVELLTQLHYNEIEYSDGSSPAHAVMNILARLPKMVDFNDYSEEDLKPIDNSYKDPVTKATEIMKEKNIEFSEAIKEVLYPQV